MATEPTEAPADVQEPATETPEPPQEPAEDTPQPEQQVDYKARYESAQAVIARQGHELGLYRAGQAPEDDGADEEPDEGEPSQDAEGRPDPYLAKLEHESWEHAERIYGADAMDAYRAASRVFDRAATPTDFVAAFEAYYEVRSGGGSKAEATEAATEAAKPTAGRSRAEAVQPRVDADRSDAGPDPSVVEQLEEARKKGGPESLAKFVSAATTALGFGGGKGQPGR